MRLGGTANLAVLGGNLPPSRTHDGRPTVSAHAVRTAVGRVARQNGPVARSIPGPAASPTAACRACRTALPACRRFSNTRTRRFGPANLLFLSIAHRLAVRGRLDAGFTASCMAPAGLSRSDAAGLGGTATGPFCRATRPTAARTTRALNGERSSCVRLGSRLPPRTGRWPVPPDQRHSSG